MKLVGRQEYWLVLAFALAAGCSNGTGSVTDRPSASSTSPPPEATPTPTPPSTPEPSPPAPEPPAPPPTPSTSDGSALAGFWEGRTTEGAHDDDAQPAVALIDRFGQMQLIIGSGADPEFVLHGNVCCEAAVSESVVGLRYERTGRSDVDLRIGLTDGQLTGEFEYRGKHRFSLSPSSAYVQPLTLHSVAGVYTRTGQSLEVIPSTLTWSIDERGELTGTHSNGCSYSGRVSIPDTQRNMARLDVQLSGCGSHRSSSDQWNGSYLGLAILRGNALYQSLAGPTWLGAQSLEK